MSNNTNGSNVSLIAASVAYIRDKHNELELGIAVLAAAICECWLTPMRAVANEGKANEQVWFFTLADMFRPRMRTDKDGVEKVNGFYLPAAYVSLAMNFGVEGEFDGQDKIEFKRAWRIAAARMILDIPVVFSPKGAEFPLHVVFDLIGTETVELDPMEDGTKVFAEQEVLTALGRNVVEFIQEAAEDDGETLTEEQAIAKMKQRRCVINGKVEKYTKEKAPRLAKFADKFAEPLTALGLDNFVSRNGSTDEGIKFDGNVSSVVKALQLILDPKSEESLFAPTLTRNAALVSLVDLIEDYLTSEAAVIEQPEQPSLDLVPALLDEQPESPALGARPDKRKPRA